MELVEHIKGINKRTINGALFVEDASYWADIGIETVSQFDRYLNEVCFSKFYKMVYGDLPNFDIGLMSNEELDHMTGHLLRNM